jgi:RNA polymerase subunit RPABC4/transcription elongation factor Spt4
MEKKKRKSSKGYKVDKNYINCIYCGKELTTNWLFRHIKMRHNIKDPEEYYLKYINPSITEEQKLCPNCGNKKYWSGLPNGYGPTCGSQKCKGELKSKELISKGHNNPLYYWWSSQEAQNMRIANANKQISEGRSGLQNWNLNKSNNRLIKNDIIPGSEIWMRFINCLRFSNHNSFNKFAYLYLIELKDKLKLGSTTNIDLRNSLIKGNIILLYKSNPYCVSELEKILLIKYRKYTLLNNRKSSYTEYLDLSCKENLLIELNKFINYKEIDLTDYLIYEEKLRLSKVQRLSKRI